MDNNEETVNFPRMKCWQDVLGKITNEEFRRRVNEYRHEITEDRMTGKPKKRRIQMLHDLANDGDYVALKQAAKDRDGWTHMDTMCP